MDKTKKSPFLKILLFVFCVVLIIAAYATGDSSGYKRGFQETAKFTVSKLGVDADITDYDQYDAAIDAYLEESKSVRKSLDTILSSDSLEEEAGDIIIDAATNAITDFITDLFGEGE